MGFLADDCVYHNMPLDPVKGSAAIRAVLQSFAGSATGIEWELHQIAETEGGVVLTERTDRFEIGGRWIALPVMGLIMAYAWPQNWSGISGPAWIGLAYVSVFSMLVGFFFWYHGLAQGGIAAVGQLQLLQPFFGLMLAAMLLNEQVSAAMFIVTLGIVACVAGAKKFA